MYTSLSEIRQRAREEIEHGRTSSEFLQEKQKVEATSSHEGVVFQRFPKQGWVPFYCKLFQQSSPTQNPQLPPRLIMYPALEDESGFSDNGTLTISVKGAKLIDRGTVKVRGGARYFALQILHLANPHPGRDPRKRYEATWCGFASRGDYDAWAARIGEANRAAAGDILGGVVFRTHRRRGAPAPAAAAAGAQGGAGPAAAGADAERRFLGTAAARRHRRVLGRLAEAADEPGTAPRGGGGGGAFPGGPGGSFADLFAAAGEEGSIESIEENGSGQAGLSKDRHTPLKIKRTPRLTLSRQASYRLGSSGQQQRRGRPSSSSRRTSSRRGALRRQGSGGSRGGGGGGGGGDAPPPPPQMGGPWARRPPSSVDPDARGVVRTRWGRRLAQQPGGSYVGSRVSSRTGRRVALYAPRPGPRPKTRQEDPRDPTGSLPGDVVRALVTGDDARALRFVRAAAGGDPAAAGRWDPLLGPQPGDRLLNLAARHRRDLAELAAVLGVWSMVHRTGSTLPVFNPDGRTALLQQLIDLGAIVNGTDGDGATALCTAAKFGCWKECELLIEAGANVDAPDVSGDTPLCLACAAADRATVHVLLTHGADPRRGNCRGVTPLLTASSQGDCSIVRMLLAEGSAALAALDPGVENDDSGNPRAAESPENVAAAQTSSPQEENCTVPADNVPAHSPVGGAKEEKNGSRNKLPGKGDTDKEAEVEEEKKPVIINGLNLEHKTTSGITALYAAAQRGHVEVLRLLLALGARTEAPTAQGITPLYAAAEQGHSYATEVLLQAGAYSRITDFSGDTPLHAAARAGNLPTIFHLLDYHADLHKMNSKGETPWMIAQASAGMDVRAIKLHLEQQQQKILNENKEDTQSGPISSIRHHHHQYQQQQRHQQHHHQQQQHNLHDHK